MSLGDLVADEQLDRAADDVEQLAGLGVMVRMGTINAVQSVRSHV